MSDSETSKSASGKEMEDEDCFEYTLAPLSHIKMILLRLRMMAVQVVQVIMKTKTRFQGKNLRNATRESSL